MTTQYVKMQLAKPEQEFPFKKLGVLNVRCPKSSASYEEAQDVAVKWRPATVDQCKLSLREGLGWRKKRLTVSACSLSEYNVNDGLLPAHHS